MSTSETRELILDKAEELFASKGFAATSLRSITAAAGVNLAAVSYYFGGKEALAKEVIRRRLAPVNLERMRLLDLAEGVAGSVGGDRAGGSAAGGSAGAGGAGGEAGDRDGGAVGARGRAGKGERAAGGPGGAAGSPTSRTPNLESIIRAFILPALQLERDVGPAAEAFKRLMGRIHGEHPPFLDELFVEECGELIRRFLGALGRAVPGLPPDELVWRVHFLIGSMAHTLCSCSLLKLFDGGLCDVEDVDGVGERLVAFIAGGMRAPAVAGVTEKEKVR